MPTSTGRAARLALLLALNAAPASAQQWYVSADAGRMRPDLDPDAASISGAMGARYEAPSAGFGLSAGVPTGAQATVWGAAGAWKRWLARRSGFVAGMDLSGSAFLSRDRSEAQPESPFLPGRLGTPLEPGADVSGHALAVQALPLAGYESPRLHLHARTGASGYTARFGDVGAERVVGLADVRISLLPTPSLALTGVARGFHARDENLPTYAGLSVLHQQGGRRLWAGVGHWIDGDVDSPWEAGASVAVHRRISLEASVRRDTFDPLQLQVAQTMWRMGVAVQVGGPPGAPRLPVPARYVGGRATIRLPVSESRSAPRIAGAFNGWKPASMQRSGDDWTYSVDVAPGVYEYAFVNERGDWFVPTSVPGRKDDGMGGHVAVLVVQ